MAASSAIARSFQTRATSSRTKLAFISIQQSRPCPIPQIRHKLREEKRVFYACCRLGGSPRTNPNSPLRPIPINDPTSHSNGLHTAAHTLTSSLFLRQLSDVVSVPYEINLFYALQYTGCLTEARSSYSEMDIGIAIYKSQSSAAVIPRFPA